ncbi:MAG: acyltransferase [Bifidobacteriaceae bacterium]|jgi:fucose 4-O-acetylase-like acetyltransferase|nr:acyltransferase [Bifidobacteriaceae bacterium]MCI1979002.1 acyltransferase [Bifidobacteriaceae bacterium]
MTATSTPSSPSRRLEWVDALRGLGILFVIVGHTSRIPQVTQWIYAFHMPLFFWLSGYLFHARPPRQFIRRKVFTLLIPYLFFGVLAWFFWAFFEYDYGDHADDVVPALQNLFIGRAGNVNNPANAPLWFLLCLFMTEIAFLFLFLGARTVANAMAARKYGADNPEADRLAEWLRLSIIAAAPIGSALGGAALIHAKFQRLPLTLDIVPVAIAFMGLGYLSKQVSHRVVAFPAVADRVRAVGAIITVNCPLWLRRICVGIVLPLGIGAVVGVQLRVHGVHVDLANNVMRIPSVAYAAAAVMIFAVYLVAKNFSPKFLQYLGRASIVILGVHDVVKHEVIEAVASVTDLSTTEVRTAPLWVAVMSAVILGISVLLYELVDRTMPFVIGKQTVSAWRRDGLRTAPSQPLPSYGMPLANQMQRI